MKSKLIILLFPLLVGVFRETDAQVYEPWPNAGAWKPYTYSGQANKDRKIQDPSNGGTSPQSYANISSGNPDTTLSSFYFATNGPMSVIFLRFRVEAMPVSYTGGASYSNSDPFAPIKWTFLIDINGDGWRDFAVVMDGGSGGPGNEIDDLRFIYSTSTTTQSIDTTSPGVYKIGSMKTAVKEGSILAEYDGTGNKKTGAMWDKGRSTIVYDFGATRVMDSTGSNGDYIVDIQLPISKLDAFSVGGPTVTPSTPLSVAFCTANSNTNPFQKDVAYLGALVGGENIPMPGSDFTSFNGTVNNAPIITQVTTTACPNVTLTATVYDAIRVVNGLVTSTVDSVKFYYWLDSSVNGDTANDGSSSWVFIGKGTMNPIGTWSISSWNSGTAPSGLLLIKAVAYDNQGLSTDSYHKNNAQYGSPYGFVANSCGLQPPYLQKTANVTSVQSQGNIYQRNIIYTVVIRNDNTSPVAIDTVWDQLPTGFTFRSDTTIGGSLSHSAMLAWPTPSATGTIFWVLGSGSGRSIGANSKDSISFNVYSGTTAGTFKNTVTAHSPTTPVISATNVAPVVVSDASASLTKSASKSGSLARGDTVTYTIRYQNTGNVPLTSDSIFDALPAGLNFISATNSGAYTSATRIVRWRIGSGTLDITDTGSVSVTVSVSNPFSGSSPIINSAYMTAFELVSAVTSNSVSHTIVSPLLTITNSVSPAVTVPGAYVTYTINYSNIGTGKATYDTITAKIPDSLSYVSGTASLTPIVSGRTLKWGIDSILAGSSNNIITYQALVKNFGSPQANFIQIDTAFIKSNETSTIYDTAVTQINAIPNVSVAKSATPTSTVAAKTIRFKLTFTNSGSQPAIFTSIIDSLPNGFTYTGSPSGMSVKPPRGTTGYIYWPVDSLARSTLAPGAEDSIAFNVTASSTPNTYTNTGRAKGYVKSTSIDSVSGSASVTVIDSTLAVTSTVKSVNKSVVMQGDTLIYTLTTRNDSTTSKLPSLRIIDVLPPFVRYVSHTSSSINGSTITAWTKTVVAGSPINRDSLNFSISNDFAKTAEIKINIWALDSIGTPDQTTLSNYFSGWWGTGGGSIKRTSNIVTTLSRSAPNITLTKTVSQANAPTGTLLTYTINYNNASNAGLSTNTIIIDTLPRSVWYKPGSASNGGAFDSSASTWRKRIVWNLGSVPASGSGSVSFQAYIRTDTSGSFTNTARLYNNEARNRSSSATTSIAGAPKLSLTKTVNKTLAAPGDTLIYIMTLLNSATDTSARVDTLSDAIPYGTKLISTTPAALTPPNPGDSTGTVKWVVGTLTAGNSYVCTLKVQIKKPLASGSITSITNTASNTCIQVPSTVSNTVTTTISYPQQTLSKSVDKGTASPGDTLTYTIVATNNSLVSVTADTLTDIIPINTTFVSVSGNVGAVASQPSVGGTGTVKWAIGTLASNSSATLTLKVKVVSSLENGTKITNSATLTTDMTSTSVASNVASTTINSAPILSMTKTVDKGSASAGDTLRYTIVYRNTGNSDATNYQLTDPIPTYTTYILGTVSGAGASYNPFSNSVVVSRSTLASGTSDTVRFRVKISAQLSYGSNTLTNTATASASNGTSTPGSVSTNVTTSSTLSINKSGPITSDLNGSPLTDTITYSIAYTVTGTAASDSIFINDVLPSNLLYLSSSPTADVKPSIGSNGTVKWSLGTKNPNSSGQVSVTVTTITAGTYNNTASITSKQNVAGVNSNTVTTTVSAPHTGLITQTPTRRPGQIITINVSDLDLKNEGVIFVSSVNLRTNETESVGLSESPVGSGSFSGTVGTMYDALPGSDNNGFFAVQAGDSIRSTYIDLMDSTRSTVNKYAYTRIFGGVTGAIIGSPNPVTPGDTVSFDLNDKDLDYDTTAIESYTLQITTTRGETETRTFVETGVKTGIFRTYIWTVSGTGPGPNGNDTLTVLSGDSVKVTYLDSLTLVGGTRTNIAVVGVRSVDFSTSQKTWSDMNGGSAMPPDTIKYKIMINNTGGRTTTLVAVVDTIPIGVTILTGTLPTGATVNGRVITFQSFALPNNIDSLLYSVRIDSSIATGVAAINIAHITANGVDQKVTASFTPVNQPLMTIVKSVSVSHGQPGDTLTYSIEYRNVGTSNATSVIVTDPNPNYTTYVPNSVIVNGVNKNDDPDDGDGVKLQDGIIQITIGTVQPGQTGTITFRTKIN